MTDRLVPIDTARDHGEQFPPLVNDEIDYVVSLKAPDVVLAYLATLGIGFVDIGLGRGYFTIGGVPISGELVPPAATWSSVAGKPFHDVRDYGAVGNGVTDDTDAIEAAWAASNGNIGFGLGNFLYNGDGLDPPIGQARIWGFGRQNSIVTLGPDSYLLLITGLISRLDVRDFTVLNGKGAIKHTYTGTNVTEHFTVDNMRFKSYTECAIATDSSDMPYWKINRCMFDGINTIDPIGIALSGLTDDCAIDNCSFLRNRIHIKAREGGNNLQIANCDLLRFSTANTNGPRVDVWVIPNVSPVNSGGGLTVRSSKFGNENLVAGDFRVLYADEGPGTSNGNMMPDLTSDSTGYITGHRITDNAFYSIGNDTPSVVYSTTPHVLAVAIENNYIQRAKYMLEFRTPSTTPDRVNSVNLLGPNAGYANVEGFLTLPSNTAGAGVLPDPASMFPSSESVNPGAATPGSYRSLLSTAIGSFQIVASRWTKNADITDALGGTEAATYTASHTNAQLYSSIATAMTAGIPVWVEFDIKNPDDGNALSQLQVYVQDSGTAAYHWRRSVPVPTVAQGWVTHAFSFVPRESGAAGRSIVFSNADTTLSKSVSLGRVRVYHGNSRQIGGKRPAVTGASTLHTELTKLGLVTSTAPAPASTVLDFPEVSANTYQSLTMTVPGAAVGDCLVLAPGTATAGIVYSAYASAVNTVTVLAHNYTGSPLNPGSGTFKVAIVR